MKKKLKYYWFDLKRRKTQFLKWYRGNSTIQALLNTVFIVCIILTVQGICHGSYYGVIIHIICLLGVICYVREHLLFELIVGIINLVLCYCAWIEQLNIGIYICLLSIGIFAILHFCFRLYDDYVKILEVQCSNGFWYKKEYKIYKKVVRQYKKIGLMNQKEENIDDNFTNYLKWKQYFVNNFIKEKEFNENFKAYLTNMKREREYELNLTNAMIVPLVITLYSIFLTWDKGGGFLLIFAGVWLICSAFILHEWERKKQFYEDCLKIIEELER